MYLPSLEAWWVATSSASSAYSVVPLPRTNPNSSNDGRVAIVSAGVHVPGGGGGAGLHQGLSVLGALSRCKRPHGSCRAGEVRTPDSVAVEDAGEDGEAGVASLLREPTKPLPLRAGDYTVSLP